MDTNTKKQEWLEQEWLDFSCKKLNDLYKKNTIIEKEIELYIDKDYSLTLQKKEIIKLDEKTYYIYSGLFSADESPEIKNNEIMYEFKLYKLSDNGEEEIQFIIFPNKEEINGHNQKFYLIPLSSLNQGERIRLEETWYWPNWWYSLKKNKYDFFDFDSRYVKGKASIYFFCHEELSSKIIIDPENKIEYTHKIEKIEDPIKKTKYNVATIKFENITHKQHVFYIYNTDRYKDKEELKKETENTKKNKKHSNIFYKIYAYIRNKIENTEIDSTEIDSKILNVNERTKILQSEKYRPLLQEYTGINGAKKFILAIITILPFLLSYKIKSIGLEFSISSIVFISYHISNLIIYIEIKHLLNKKAFYIITPEVDFEIYTKYEFENSLNYCLKCKCISKKLSKPVWALLIISALIKATFIANKSYSIIEYVPNSILELIRWVFGISH